MAETSTSTGNHRRASSVRAPLAAVSIEGGLATVFIILTGGAYITGLALLWGANDFEIGLLAAIPFLAQFAQLPAAVWIDRTGLRKSITVWSAVAARQSWWLLVPLLFLPAGWRLEFLIGVVIFSAFSIMISTVGWLAWVADLVPDRIRGRYFGMRSVSVAVSTLIATISGGIILDHFRGRGEESLGFAIIIAAGCAFALAASILLGKVPDRSRDQIRVRTNWQSFLEPLKDPKFRRVLKVFSMWNFAIGTSAAFFAPHMLTNLRMSFTQISLYSSAAALVAIGLNRPWGAVIDRFGCKPVITFCAFGIAFIPTVWVFPRPDFLWVLIPEVFFSAILWAGFNLAAFNMPIAFSPKNHRTIYLAVFAVVTGFAFFAASLIGGTIAEALSGLHWKVGPQTIVNYHVLFVLSTVLRLLTAFMVMSFHEPNETRLPVLMQFIGYSVLKFLSVGRQVFPAPPRLPDQGPAHAEGAPQAP